MRETKTRSPAQSALGWLKRLPASLASSRTLRRELQARGHVAITDYPYAMRPRGGPFPALEPLIACSPAYRDAFKTCDDAMRRFIDGVPAQASAPALPFWNNGYFPFLDALSLAVLLRQEKPDVLLEIGSGNSTKFARAAIKAFALTTRIVSVDPYPRAEVDALCDEVIRAPFEDSFEAMAPHLDRRCLVLADNSHRTFPQSDVTRFFLDLVPSLKPGTVWGVHDIFLPFDYPDDWVVEGRAYNEQYVMAAYLLGGAVKDEILMPVYWMSRQAETRPGHVPDSIDANHLAGGMFWLKRR